jgi:ABC-type sugar transport system ATPase subunit
MRSTTIRAQERSDAPLSTAAGALLCVGGVAKSFGPTVALRSCTLDVAPGEVHAVIGENGSGKSTLVKILSGVHEPDRGEIHVGGREVEGFAGPRAAGDAGIATVFQEVLLAGRQSVLENVWMGTDGFFRSTLGGRAKRARAAEVIGRLMEGPPELDAPARALPLSHQQVCVIARALVRDPRLLILDEATSALDVATRERLFATLREMTARGAGVIFISHRMDEVEQLADRVTVLRSGKSVATLTRSEASSRELVRLMTGGEHLVGEQAHPRARVVSEGREVVLQTAGLRLRPQARPIEVGFQAGELVGLAGLEGHGQEVFLRALGGQGVVAGSVMRERSGSATEVDSPWRAARAGIAYVPRDRRSESLFPSLSTRENFAVATLSRDVRLGLLRHRLTERRMRAYIDQLRVKLGSPRAPVTTLSGGNQQKVVIARWLAARPDILLLNDPTRGVDLGAKRDIYALLRKLAEEGVAVIMLSTEVDELIELMDRVLVFREGELFAELSREQLSRGALVAAFFGEAGREVSE